MNSNRWSSRRAIDHHSDCFLMTLSVSTSSKCVSNVILFQGQPALDYDPVSIYLQRTHNESAQSLSLSLSLSLYMFLSQQLRSNSIIFLSLATSSTTSLSGAFHSMTYITLRNDDNFKRFAEGRYCELHSTRYLSM